MLGYVIPLLYAVRPSMVYEIVRRRMSEIIPLNVLLGIEIASIGNGVAETRLPVRQDLTNHIGTLHASAIFAVAEAASGGAMSGAFAPVILNVRPVAANATIEFLKPAKTSLVARAKTLEEPAALRDRLDKDGKVAFDLAVVVADEEGNNVARVKVGWHVAAKK